MVGRTGFLMGFPFRFPIAVGSAGSGTGSEGSAGQSVAVGGFDDASRSGHGGEALVEGGGAYAAGGAQIGEGPRLSCIGKDSSDSIVDGDGHGLGLLPCPFDDYEGEGVGPLDEFESDRRNG